MVLIEPGSDHEAERSVEDKVDSELCYYNQGEKVWKLFKNGEWISQADKPTAEQLGSLEIVTDKKKELKK